MSDEEESIEQQLSDAASEAHEWKLLMESPGWARLEKFLKEQQALRASACMLTPINNEYGAFAQEFYKGEYGGIGLALATPATQRELADLRKKTLSKELEAEHETQAQLAAADARGRRNDGDPFGGDSNG